MTRIARRKSGFVVAAVLAAIVGVAGAGPAVAASRVAGGGPAQSPASGPGCLVVDADDAATLRLQCGGELRTLRLASVRAPRPGPTLLGGEPYGSDGRELVRGWFVGKRVEVGGGTAFLGGEDVRLGLLRLGVVEWSGAATPASAALRAAEREARLGSRGLWSIDAWRRHQATAREPLLVPGTPPLAPAESIGTAAARFPRKDEAQRRAAFEAALAQLKTMPPVAAAAVARDPEPAAPKPHRRSRGSRRAESTQPR